MAATIDSRQPDEPGPVDGTPLGSGYVLVRSIGQGAYGRVWQGLRRSDSASVAIKVMRSEYLADPDVLGRFLRERTVLMDLDHPHLVRVEDLVVEGETVAVIMQLVDGVDLRKTVRQGQLGPDDALTILAQVAHALAYIHANGTLHRDIKPENILVTMRDGLPYALVADFGLAWVSDGQALTQTSHVPGTPAYLAPEQLSGRPYGPEVDIYALGVTAYELLSGRRPFHGENALALMRAHLDDEPRRPESMTDEQWRVVRACLAKAPGERPTAAQLVPLFENLRRGADVVRLGIDVGTFATSAVVWWPDGRVEPLLFDGSPRLPCAVFVDPAGTALVGRAALEAGAADPRSCEPYPKLRVADDLVHLGDRDVEPVELIAAILRRVAEQIRQRAGTAPTRVTISHPGTWSPEQVSLLADAARRAGLAAPQLVTEGVAAAAHCVGVPASVVPPDAYAIIADLGAAATTMTVVRRTTDGGFEVVASEQLPDAGGIDIDTAILTYLGEQLASAFPQAWQRLSQPATAQDRGAAWRLWREVQQAKESLSEATTAMLRVPLLDDPVPLRRDEVERLAQPLFERIVELARVAVAAAGITFAEVSAILLVGGSSRMPMTAAALGSAIGRQPVLVRQPELVVAEGAAHLTPLRSLSPSIGTPGTATAGRAGRTMRSPKPSELRDRRSATGRRGTEGPWQGLSGSGDLSGARHRRNAHRFGRLRIPAVAGLLAVSIAAMLLYTSISSGFGSVFAGSAACGNEIGFLGQVRDPSIAGLYNAVRLAVEQYNAAHPTCTAQLVPLDTVTDPAGQARNAVTDAKMLGVVGPMFNNESALELPVLEAGGLVAISPWLSDTKVSRQGYRVFHRTLGTNIDDADADARQLVDGFNANRTFVLADRSVNGLEASQEVRTQLGAARVAGSATIADPEADPATVVDQIVNSGATALYYGGYSETLAPVLKQLRTVRPAMTVLVGEWSFTDVLSTLAGNAAVGIYATCPCAPAERTGHNFGTAFRTRFATGLAVCEAEAYDAVNVLLDGLSAGMTTRAKLLDWVNRYNRDGASGHIRFTSTGDLADATVWVWRMTENQHFTVSGTVPGNRASR